MFEDGTIFIIPFLVAIPLLLLWFIVWFVRDAYRAIKNGKYKKYLSRKYVKYLIGRCVGCLATALLPSAVKLNRIFDYEEFETFDLHWQWTIIPHAAFFVLRKVSGGQGAFSNLALLVTIFLGIYLICAYIYWSVWLFKLLRARTKLSAFFILPITAGSILAAALLLDTILTYAFRLIRLVFST